jgi:type IV secretion system protein VirD4
MTDAQRAEVRQRTRNLLIYGPLGILTVGVVTTQFVAWHLNYDPALGAPLIKHAYWPWRIIQWWNAPWEPQVSTTFDFVKFGLLLSAAFLAMAFLKARQKPKPALDLHGTARYRSEDEIRKGRLWPRGVPGIIVGGWCDRRGMLHYQTDTSEGHVLCLGPSRIGKTASVLLPTLLSWPHSAVTYDPKGELWRLSSGWRAREAGNIVMRFAPAEKDNTVSWNPFDRVRATGPFAFRDVANIVQQIADPQGKGFSDHWEPSAANLMNGVALFLAASGKCSPHAMLSAIDASDTSETLLKAMADHPIPEVAEVGRGLLATASRERASIISTARRLLALYRDPVLAANTSTSDFRIEDLISADRPVSLYIETRGEDELRLRPVVRLLLNLILGQLLSHEGHGHKLLVSIDEMPTLRRMEPLELFLTKGAGVGIRALLLAQDYQDIVAEYGEHERITAECSTTVAHAPNSIKTAEWLSKRCGQTTKVVEEVSESRGQGSSNIRSFNRVYRSVAAPLMTPDEVTRLRLPGRDAAGHISSPGELLIFEAGQHPIRGTQSLAFLDPEFRRRMAIAVPATMRTR